MRIISGRFRGRALGTVAVGVRPTADRVRESLFASLGPLEGVRVLDLFAGTGALGLEAISRGASAAVFVERSRKVATTLKKRLKGFDLAGSGTVDVLGMSAEKAIARLQVIGADPFDLVFVDPPYADLPETLVLERLVESQLLSAEAVVVVEGPKRHALAPPSGLRMTDERIYGETKLTWLVSVDSCDS